MPSLRVVLAAPRGFCAGVRRAIDAVIDAIEVHGTPVFVRRAIVHNMSVVRALEARGAVFVEELSEVPEGAVVVLSAHGVPRHVIAEAQARKLTFYDAACPLVAKVHREVARHHRSGRHVIVVGHAGHPEIVGTLGQLPAGAASLVRTPEDVEALRIADHASIGLAVQTTFSINEAKEVVAALKSRFANLVGPSGSDICYATTNRQAAVQTLAAEVDAIIVVGEDFSSNARRLSEVAVAAGCASVQLLAEAEQLDWSLILEGGTLGITAAASTPESAISRILEALRRRFRVQVEELKGVEEVIAFQRMRIGKS